MRRGQDIRPLNLKGIKLNSDFLRIFLAFDIWIFLVLAFSFFYIALCHDPGQPPPAYGMGFFKLFFRSDGSWFVDIARYGYAGCAEMKGFEPFFATPFFPLYPLLIRIFSYPFFGNYYAAGLAVSWLSTLFALYYLFLLSRHYQEDKAGFRSCLYLLVFPTAVFLIAAYSEATFLLCAVASFYHARRSQWIRSGIWGYLACLARPVGLAVFLAVVIEALRQAEWKPSNLRARMAVVAIAPLGLLTYLIYLQVAFGDFLVLTKAEKSYWGRGFNPWGIFQSMRNMFTADGFFTVEFTQSFYLLAFAITFIFLVVIVFRRFGLSLGTYSLICLAIPLLTSPGFHPLFSINRLVLVIFPAFMVLGSWGKNRYFELLYVFFSALGLAFFTAMFISGYWAG